ncbi:acyl-CoA dehydrogenase family protein [Steroidobacter sp.]|uniref:acyl-CoA dehydrogenase family protein n=1 Tax=Steroidobacter sp. TaxID=1978227 RepID=UPI001A534DD2|nr:acyl-CoA dehydrogenase family protein [Steroidobacter sp.]MBL8271763.1 hypothetical protein [Steroidobacter sp.]
MDFTLNPDQAALDGAVERLAAAFSSKPTEFHGFALLSDALEQALLEAEFFDIALIPEFGPLSAAIAVERLARLPFTAEFALSMLLRPQLHGDWPRPLAIVERGRPSRFLASAKTVLIIDEHSVGIAQLDPVHVESVDSLFAYPMARLKGAVTTVALSDTEAANVLKWSRIALAAETSGLLHAAIASTVEHLSLRKQFGRPLGAFQALRHRLAECAVLAGGVRWLAFQAASTADDSDAALAAFHAQDSATRIVYDLHQMFGAMGMTLEHPLHLWTYRLKSLLSLLGGRGGQARAAASTTASSPAPATAP